MSNMSAFTKGDVVVSNTNTQGLSKGSKYEVVLVSTDVTAFGYFVTYTVAPVDDREDAHDIVNGHLILTKVGHREIYECALCGAEFETSADLQDHADYTHHSEDGSMEEGDQNG